ncbi:DNA polymerase Y family protein [Microvirga terrae]|uniref:DNA polymerase Y family protein n=1 Tax=Microvirga terrae TaxID=2740529 RepID=A0ABY5RTW5_9HYPH|nr:MULTISPECIES: DNA polymerase Y family protein [Microvirga]MBQ0822450.1 DNA polymerase Y family protein [Microvirga sp. HBU67558]UVF20701.1 DNA polymerase Y family protein [Microvirga terrae]
MRRVVSLYLPTWPTDRIRRRTGEPPRNEPLVTVHAVGSRRVVRAACAAAQEAGLHVGMPLAQAQALVPNLHVVEATPDEDDASLRELARWAIGYSPVVAPDPPDGLWIDIAGVAHLFGGEEELLTDLTSRLRRQGIASKAAVSDAPGAAWAVARYGSGGVVPTGRAADAVATLSIRALRVAADKLSALHRLGIERIGQLAAMPRAPFVRRFGRDVALRLDQAMGHAFEPITPLIPREAPTAALALAEPIGRLEDLKGVVLRLAKDLCRQLERRGEGVRRLDLLCQRVDQKSACLRVGTARANRDAVHLAKLFDERLQTIDPGFGIEEIILVASKVEPLTETQIQACGLSDEVAMEADIGPLVDRLGARIGMRKVYRLAPVQSLVPERMARRIPALAPPTGSVWPENLPRPTRLLDPPEPVVATALLPDHPPRFFLWRKVKHTVAKADGPERITPEWWNGDEGSAARDYYRVETVQGGRFWVFRDAPTAEGGRWWMHGFFS